MILREILGSLLYSTRYNLIDPQYLKLRKDTVSVWNLGELRLVRRATINSLNSRIAVFLLPTSPRSTPDTEGIPTVARVAAPCTSTAAAWAARALKDVSRRAQLCGAPGWRGGGVGAAAALVGFVLRGLFVCAGQPLVRTDSVDPCCWCRHPAGGRAQCNDDDRSLPIVKGAFGLGVALLRGRIGRWKRDADGALGKVRLTPAGLAV